MVMDEATFSGLQVLYEASEFSETGFDVVAVNGLNGHPRSSWTSEGPRETRSMWLKDLLPQDLPNARIMLFGYNCHITGEKNLLSAEGLTHAAEALLAALDSIRAGDRYHNRPLAFIAHDLGGVVVKKALVIASGSKGLSSIVNNAHQLLFCGTPHRASDLVSWEDLLFNIVVLTHSSPITLRDLSSRVRIFSTVLAQVAEDFNSILTWQNIVNIYQEESCPSTGGEESVVNCYSATMDLLYETQIGRKSRHKDLCRLSKTDPELSLILKSLKNESNGEYVECISTLLTLAPSFPVPAEARCNLEETAEYQNVEAWLRSESESFICLHYHQGLDTSAVSASLFRWLQRLKSESGIVTYYSFSGDDGRRTTSRSLLSSLTYQILSQHPTIFWQLHDILVTISKQSSWTSHTVWTIFRSLIATLGSETVYCVINDIHYCDSSWVHFLMELLELKANKKILMTVKIILIGQEREDTKDLLYFVRKPQLDGQAFSLDSLHSQRVQMIGNLIEERPYLSEFVAEIEEALDKCESLPQLSLNVHVLKDDSHKFLSNRRSISSKVQKLPYEVPDLVFKTFQTLPGWGRKALGWILHAQRPMNVNELAVAIALVDHKQAIKLNEDDRLLDLRTELYSAFGPLVKVENNEARFCHEQVKYCFQQAVKDEQEPKEIGANQETQSQNGKQQKIPLVSDWDITRILLKYLRSDRFLAATKKALREEYWERPRGPIFDLMGYAVQFWPAHYRKAKQHGSHAKEMLDLLQHRDFVQVWSELNSRFGNTFAQADMCVMDPFYLGALLGFVDIVEFYLTQETSKGVILEEHFLALYLASWAGHLDVVTTFLDNDLGNASEHLSKALHYASSQEHEEIVDLLIDKFPKPSQIVAWDPSFLCEAAELGNLAIVRKFIAAGANVDATHEGITPLQLAARNGHESIVSALLFEEADPNSLSAQVSYKAIHLAASKGYTAVVEDLLMHQVDICVTDKDERTALHLASHNGHQQIVKLLLEQHLNVVAKAKDRHDQTALHLASLEGHTEVVKLFTQGIQDLDMDIQDDLGRTPLILASQKGHLPVVQLLLDKGATTDLPDNEDESGHTALYYATFNGHEAIAEKILQATNEALTMTDITEILIQAAKQGFTSVCTLCLSRFSEIDLDAIGCDGYPALHQAAENGHIDIVSLLIKYGATVDLKTDQISTPLALAASAGRGQVVRVLLDADAKSLARVDDRTLVTEVACCSDDTDGYVDAVRAMLEVGHGVNEVDDNSYSALHFAALSGSVKVARTLLEYGANPALQDMASWTPLHWAAQHDRGEIVRLFINHGVDLLIVDDDGWTSMHIAASHNCVSVMEVLWEAAPALLTCRSYDGQTPLHFASNISETGPTEWLLAHSVDVDAVRKGGRTALMRSAESGHDEIVGLLLSHNANVRLLDNRQKTALHVAAINGRTRPAQKILEKDISIINWQDDCGFSALHTAIRHERSDVVSILLEQMPYIDINLKDKSGDTPLLLAVHNRLDDVVKHLLRCEAETASRNKKSETALLLAIEKKAETIWMTLLQDSVHVNVNEGGGAFPTALHMAANSGKLDVVQQLLRFGADVNAEGGLYNTALQAAAAGGFVDVVEYLLMKGADASLGGGLFANALSAAVSSGTVEIIESLYEKKAEINAQDDQGRTALHLAVWRGSMDVIKWLTERKGDLNIKDHQGRTVVHHAAMAGNVGVVRMLMQDEKWLLLNVEDVDGWTPSHWACRNNEEMIKLLNGGETMSNKETRYGWTAEIIARFYGALELPALAVKELTGNEESAEAVEKAPQQPKRKKRTWKIGFSHGLHTCDGCLHYPIVGIQWHCTECEDFDFCFKCFWSHEDTHPEHRFEKKGEGPETEPEYDEDEDH